MERHDDVFVDGGWAPAHSSARTDVDDPTTEEVWASVPDADAVDVDRAVASARRALPGWSSLPASARAGFVRRLAEEVDRRASELTRLITTENGTPMAESGHAPAHAAATLRLAADLAPLIDSADVRTNPMAPGHTRVERRPVGVAGLVTPWNYPLSLIVIKLGPALVAGCTTVLKPAPETPMAARLLLDAVAAAGLPAGVVNLVTGGVDTGRALVDHPGVDKISFTGSGTAGRVIAARCGELIRPVTLELGGKSPAVVLPDADADAVAATILKVSMRNTGQTCKACTRLLVPRSREAELVDLVTDVVGSAPVGDPTDPTTFFGPLVSSRHRERVREYLRIGAAEGARATVGGGQESPRERGWFVQPTVYAGVDNSMRVAREEIFGPVLSVIAYGTEDEAAAIANDSPYGLAATVYSRDLDHATAFARRLDTGTVGINHYGSNASAPFGGVKESGIGTEMGPEGLDAFTTYRSIHRPDTAQEDVR